MVGGPLTNFVQAAQITSKTSLSMCQMFILMYCNVGTCFTGVSVGLVKCRSSGCPCSGWAISEDGPIVGGPFGVCAAAMLFWVTIVQIPAGTMLYMLYVYLGLVMWSTRGIDVRQAIVWPTPASGLGVGRPGPERGPILDGPCRGLHAKSTCLGVNYGLMHAVKSVLENL